MYLKTPTPLLLDFLHMHLEGLRLLVILLVETAL